MPKAKVSNVAPTQPASITPDTFAKAEAREITILPPKYTEKNLQTKSVEREDDFKPIVLTKKAAAKVASLRHSSRSKQSSLKMPVSVQQDPSSQEQTHESDASAPATPDKQESTQMSAAGKNTVQPFCHVHNSQEAAEFLHLNNPKNYKFLPP